MKLSETKAYNLHGAVAFLHKPSAEASCVWKNTFVIPCYLTKKMLVWPRVLSIGRKPKSHIAFVMSCSFTYQVPSRLVQLVRPTRSGLPKELGEKVAKVHLLVAGAKLVVLTPEQAHYVDQFYNAIDLASLEGMDVDKS